MLIKYIKSVLWRVTKCLSYIEEARCLKVNIVLPRLHVLIHFAIEGCKETDSIDRIYGSIPDVTVMEMPTLCEQRFAVILTKVFQFAAVGTNLVAILYASVVVYTATGRCLHHM